MGEPRIPSYLVNFNTKPRGQEFQISGTIVQDGVEDTFTERVPLYVLRSGLKPELLGNVITTGPETSFDLCRNSGRAKMRSIRIIQFCAWFGRIECAEDEIFGWNPLIHCG